MFNKVILVGRLTKDIMLKYSQSGLAVADSKIATSRKFSTNGEKKEEVCFVDITFFGRSAEVANQYIRKGSKILIEGRLTFHFWKDQNGQERSKHSVTVETMQMLDSKGDNSGGASFSNNDFDQDYTQPQSYSQPAQAYGSGAPQQKYAEPSRPQPSAQPTRKAMPEPNIPVIDIDEDEIPF